MSFWFLSTSAIAAAFLFFVGGIFVGLLLASVLFSPAGMEKRIMSAIKTFADKVNEKLNGLATAVDGVVEDVAFLKETIQKLQDSAGTVTPEDQALLDALEQRVGDLSSKVSDLDAQTAKPVEPPPTPEG